MHNGVSDKKKIKLRVLTSFHPSHPTFKDIAFYLHLSDQNI